MSRIRDKRLAERGGLEHDWARSHMKILDHIISGLEDSKPLSGLTLGFTLQLTKETSVLLDGARRLGADIIAAPGNPLTTRDDIAAFLASRGIQVYAWSGQTAEEFMWCMRRVLGHGPDIVTDDGAGLSLLANTDPDFAGLGILGGTEETTTGVLRIRSLERAGRLRYPIIAVNNASTKRLFDNRYGTGQSTVDGYLRSMNLVIASKRTVVVGYGWVGRGVASRFRAMGSRVIVTEVDPIRALDACMDGFEVMPMSSAAKTGDIFVTCTGMTDVITSEHLDSMKSGSIVGNAGHFDVEIDSGYLLEVNTRMIRPGLDECTLRNGKKILLLSKGRVANLVAGAGHPPEVMDQSFANQILSILYLSRNYNRMRPRMVRVPPSIDRRVAKSALSVMGVKMDVPCRE